MMLPVLALLELLLTVYSPALGLAVFVFALPSYLVRLNVGPFPTTLLELLFGALFIGWLVHHRQKVFTFMRNIPWKIPLLVFFLASIVGVWVAPDHWHAFGTWRAYFLEPLLLFFVIRAELADARTLRLVWVALLLSVAFVDVVALFQYAHLIASPLPWIAEHPRRVTSIFDYPNAVGLYVAPFVGVLLGSALPAVRRATDRWWRVAAWIVILLSLGACVAADSRGAIVAIVVVGVVAAWHSPFRRPVIVAVLAAMLLFFVLPVGRTMARNIATRHDASTDVRLVLWEGTAKLLIAHPVFGAGIGGFPELYNQYRLAKHTELLLYPHNIVLNFWVELGFIGMIAFFTILVALGMALRQLLRTLHPSFVSDVSRGLFCALGILVIHGLVDVPYFKNDLAMQFWLLAGIVAAIRAGVSSGQMR